MSVDIAKAEKDIKKAKTRRGKRFLKAREPKVIEGPKSTLITRGNKTTDTINQALKDLYALKKDNSVFYSQKHDIHVFEDPSLMEKYCQKVNASLFIIGNNQKKRPNNIIFGRLFENRVLDSVELGIERFKTADPSAKVPLHVRPVVVFQGDSFDYNPTFMKLKNILLDMFTENVPITHIDIMSGIQLVIVVTAVEGENDKVYLRTYSANVTRNTLRESNTDGGDESNGNGAAQERDNKILTDIGPSFDFVVRREKWASEETFHLACKRPKEIKKKENKNVMRDTVGNKVGHVFVDKQELNMLALRKRQKLKEKQQKKIEVIEQNADTDI